MLDLDYEEDSQAEADSNFVLTGAGDIVEIQATGEKRGFSEAEFEALFGLAKKGIGELMALQRAAVGLTLSPLRERVTGEAGRVRGRESCSG